MSRLAESAHRLAVRVRRFFASPSDELIYTAYDLCRCGQPLVRPSYSMTWRCLSLQVGHSDPASCDQCKSKHDWLPTFQYPQIMAEHAMGTDGATTRGKL